MNKLKYAGQQLITISMMTAFERLNTVSTLTPYLTQSMCSVPVLIWKDGKVTKSA